VLAAAPAAAAPAALNIAAGAPAGVGSPGMVRPGLQLLVHLARATNNQQYLQAAAQLKLNNSTSSRLEHKYNSSLTLAFAHATGCNMDAKLNCWLTAWLAIQEANNRGNQLQHLKPDSNCCSNASVVAIAAAMQPHMPVLVRPWPTTAAAGIAATAAVVAARAAPAAQVPWVHWGLGCSHWPVALTEA
jgi:hypothetical protein